MSWLTKPFEEVMHLPSLGSDDVGDDYFYNPEEQFFNLLIGFPMMFLLYSVVIVAGCAESLWDFVRGKRGRVVVDCESD